ncbi:type I-B CRISPR-associated protein Cas7/Csh2 [Bacteroidetes/Chlorobi group bacterium MS-B_bin-24]|jgi:CRISPR-associated protein Csh2|nr:MAG: type I-B CRISPR-associated protein Cas7/Csh2 [Bacteroidetes/Chlorobi group bacterium MS-B_bin-24]
METIRNRSEILFLYDVKDANPNGDPVDENKPRIDEETGINIVTDVRLKRTIRDYLYEFKGQEVFVRQTYTKENKLRTKEDRVKDFGQDEKNIIQSCIDIRLFGATTAIEKQTMTLTGPVQFKYGRSLHKVDLKYFKGTTVMPSREGAEQGTFWERYILPYSLIVFYGVVNENAARQQEIPLTESDLDLMFEAMWNGTKNLISGSKFGQMPRLLLQIKYKENENFHIGELDKLVSLTTNLGEESIRDVVDFKIEISPLVNELKKYQDRIEMIRYKVDERLNLTIDGYATDVNTAFNFAKIETFKF